MIDLNSLNNIDFNKKASKKEIIEIENSLNIKLPYSLKKLLLISNGFLTDEGIYIYGTDIIVERNETFEVNKYANGYIAIGDDSGGRLFLMKINDDTLKIFVVDSGDINPLDCDFIIDDLLKWLSYGCKIYE